MGIESFGNSFSFLNSPASTTGSSTGAVGTDFMKMLSNPSFQSLLAGIGSKFSGENTIMGKVGQTVQQAGQSMAMNEMLKKLLGPAIEKAAGSTLLGSMPESNKESSKSALAFSFLNPGAGAFDPRLFQGMFNKGVL